jgi:hypothetical protein
MVLQKTKVTAEIRLLLLGKNQTSHSPLGSADIHTLSGGLHWSQKHCAFLQHARDKFLHTGSR